MWILFIVAFVVALVIVIVCAVILRRGQDDETISNFRYLQKNERQQRDIEMAGDEGEHTVQYVLKDIPESRVFNNCYFDDNCFSVEIDHIVVNPYGIWVLETKNWKGKIFGSIDDDKWKKYKDDGSIKFEDNPIKQNEKHVRVLKKLFRNSRFRNCEIHSRIVFVDYINCSMTFYDERFVFACELKNNLTRGERALSQNDIDDICRIIESCKRTRTREEHNRINEEAPIKIHQGICPKCGRNLQINDGVYSCECGFRFFTKNDKKHY